MLLSEIDQYVIIMHFYSLNFIVATKCDDCPVENMDIAKYAVKEITDEFDDEQEWALQHIEDMEVKVQTN